MHLHLYGLRRMAVRLGRIAELPLLEERLPLFDQVYLLPEQWFSILKDRRRGCCSRPQ
jgi:hypothetical protein